jgi:putative transposase
MPRPKSLLVSMAITQAGRAHDGRFNPDHRISKGTNRLTIKDPRWIVCGVPDVLYTDNGSDFTSQHLEQVGADLKIRLVFSIPGKPRGRGRVERFFSTVNEMFLCELDGYAPAGGVVRGKPTLTLAECDARFRAFLLDVYQCRENAETKMPPLERWEANGFLPRMPDSVEQLDLLLIQVIKARQVRADGIHFHNLRYISTTLAAYVGETVTLRFDPRDMAEIRVFHEDKFLCRAGCAELAGESVPLLKLSAPETGGGGNCVASFEIVKLP